MTYEDADIVGVRLDEGVPLRERCEQKQTAALEGCETSEEPQACFIATQALLESCEALPDDVVSVCTGIGEGEGAFWCDGQCETQKCTVANPCNLGKDMDGDGANDSCVTGQRCAPAAEGTVCDPGVLWHCECTTFYYPKNAIRPLDECRCYCD